MRLGLVTDFYYPWVGGPSTVVRTLGQGLSDRNHEVFLLAPSPDGAPSRSWEGNVRVDRVRTLPVPFGYGVRASAPFIAVEKWLDSVRPDVVHVHHPFPLSAATIFAAKRRGIPVVATNHTIPACTLWGVRNLKTVYRLADTTFSAWIRFLLSRVSAVATPTETAAAALRAIGYEGVVSVISNGVDVERFRPGPPNPDLHDRLGLDGRPVVLYTGRLDAEKQMEVWLRAAAMVASSGEVQFVVGGQGTERTRLECLAVQLGIETSVRFIGYVDDAEFADLYRLAALYMVTSPVELQSIATLEAVASGLPVVAVNAGALPELVRSGRNGFLVEPGDWTSAADAVGRILALPGAQAVFGEASRQVALVHDVGLSVGAYERLLQNHAKEPGGDRPLEPPAIPGA